MQPLGKKSMLQVDEIISLFRLWNASYPKRVAYDSLKQFQAYLKKLGNLEHLLIKTSEKEILGWYFEFTRDNDRWFGIIISDKLRGKGWGKKLMQMAPFPV